MDPVSAIGLVENSLGLALQFGSVAKALNDVAGKYKTAKLAIKSLAQNLDILELAWTQIGEWFQGYAEESLLDDGLTKRVEGFLETGKMVMEALEHDLQAYDIDHLSFSQRSKLVWNENSLQGHQSRIRDQALSMSLFLQAVNLPTPQATAKLLQKSEIQFQKSNESAHSIDSIVPSRMSVSTSQRDSCASGQSQETIGYRQLSFEERLFTSKVYMRNCKNMMIKEMSKGKIKLKPNSTATATAQISTDWEAIRDELESDSLLTSCEVSINDNDTIRCQPFIDSRPRLSEEYNTAGVSGPTSDNELIQACEQGDSIAIKRLLLRGIDLHTRFIKDQYYGLTAIHVATTFGNVNVIEALLGYGCRVEEEETWAIWRPLHFAARSGNIFVVKLLLLHNAQVDAKSRNEIQPIHLASRSGSIEVLDVLIGAGAAVDCSDWLGRQPLHYASMVPNQSDVIMHLKRKGVDIEAKASDGSRPLRLACTSGPSNLQTLIELGAKMDYDDGSESALETAVRRDSKLALEVLLKHGANPNRKNDDGKTVLHLLAQVVYTANLESPNRIECFQLLLNNGADVDLADKAGNRVLHCLAVLFSEGMRHTVVIEQLAKLVLDQGAEINATNKNRLTPLGLAIQGGDYQLSTMLIKSGARLLSDVGGKVTTVDSHWRIHREQTSKIV